MILSFSPVVRKMLFKATIFSLVTVNASANLSDIESTRSMGQAGAGVGSILLNESSLLNPAAAVFYNAPTFYIQKNSHKLNDQNAQRTSDYRDGSAEIVSVTDTSSNLKGGFTYARQIHGHEKRTRYALSMANSLSKDSAIGLIYRYSDEDSDSKRGYYSQAVLGYTKIVSPGLTFGLTIVDPFLTVKEHFKATIGVQYSLFSSLDLIADAGTGDHRNFKSEVFTKAALQIRAFERFYIRYGMFNDKRVNLKGNSLGLSWVGPKFSVDYSYKNSEIIDDIADKFFKDEQLYESSLAVTILF